MPKTTPIRILHVMKFLYENTDDDHHATISDILLYLQSVGIEANRRTISSDIEHLLDFGCDIIEIKSTQNRYHIGQRQFELAELKMLVDAIQSSRFISKTKSNQIIQKLSSMVSIHQSDILNRNLYIDKKIKAINESVIYTIDLLHEAINTKTSIEFQYYNYNVKKQKELKHGGRIYGFCPYDLIWNDDSYYVVGYSLSHQKVVTFRVDRISQPKLSEIKFINKPSTYDIETYAKQVFQMYDGETYTVELKCENSLMNTIIDRFGENVKTRKYDDRYFVATMDISASPTFYGWLFTFAGRIVVLSPIDVRNRYRDYANKIIEDLNQSAIDS